jgi:hypothetical protein
VLRVITRLVFCWASVNKVMNCLVSKIEPTHVTIFLQQRRCRSRSLNRRHFTTDGQSASSSWCRAPFGASDQMLHLFQWQLLSFFFSCRAPSLTRGRVCNLQCNDASSISSFIATDGLSSSSSWCRAPSGAHYQILISVFGNYFLSSRCRAPSPISPMKLKVKVKSQSHVSAGRNFQSYHWEGCMGCMECNVEVGYQLSICSGTKENHGKPWSSWPVAGPSGCKVTSIQQSGIISANPNKSP